MDGVMTCISESVRKGGSTFPQKEQVFNLNRIGRIFFDVGFSEVERCNCRPVTRLVERGVEILFPVSHRDLGTGIANWALTQFPGLLFLENEYRERVLGYSFYGRAIFTHQESFFAFFGCYGIERTQELECIFS